VLDQPYFKTVFLPDKYYYIYLESIMVNSSNPLAKHFRQPQIYIKLPTGGRWWPEGSLSMPATKELPVYAMTAKDELTLQTPDALLNGQSTVDVIQSCVPNIKNAWLMPAADLDAVLIAIRQATYGSKMDFVSVCPHCKSKNDHTIDLGVLSAQIHCPDFETSIVVDDLELFLKPQNYKEFNKASIENFEQQRILAVVADETLSEEEKIVRFNQLFKKLLDLTIEQITKSIAAIKTSDGIVVEDRSQIDEFFQNCNKQVWDAVKNRIEEIGNQSPLKKVDVVCEQDECEKPYTTPLVFEQSSFFG